LNRIKFFLILIAFVTLFLSCLHGSNDTTKKRSENFNSELIPWHFPGDSLNRYPITANRVVKTLIDSVKKIKFSPSVDTLYYYLKEVKKGGFNLVTVNLTPSNNSLKKQDKYYYTFFSALSRINDEFHSQLRCIVYDSRIRKLTPKEFLPFILNFYDREEVYGFSYDEPREKEFYQVKDWVEAIDSVQIRGKLKNKLFYVNLFGLKAIKDYEHYVYSLLNLINLRILSFDHYPLWDDKLAKEYGDEINSDWINDYFLNLEFIRQTSLKANLPFFCWILIHKHWSNYSKLYYRRASEEDLKFQVYSSLAYGSKGIFYYNFWNKNIIYNKSGWHEEEGILDYNFEETELYPIIKSINTQLAQIGDVLLQLTSVGVYHKVENYYDNNINSNNKKIELEKRYSLNFENFEIKNGIKLIDWNDSKHLQLDDLENKFINNIDNPAALFGLFKDLHGSQYFILVNKNRNREEKFKVVIDQTKLSRQTDNMIVDLLTNKEISYVKDNLGMIPILVNLPPGSASFIKIN